MPKRLGRPWGHVKRSAAYDSLVGTPTTSLDLNPRTSYNGLLNSSLRQAQWAGVEGVVRPQNIAAEQSVVTGKAIRCMITES